MRWGLLPSSYGRAKPPGVGCLPASIALIIIFILIIGFFAFVYWAYQYAMQTLGL